MLVLLVTPLNLHASLKGKGAECQPKERSLLLASVTTDLSGFSCPF